MHQCGIPNVVVSQGTAVTAEQARMIRKLCTRVVILLDGDEAGTLAAERAISPLLEAGCLCEVVSLPDGEDPCSYGLQYGAKSLGEAVSCGVDFMRWFWDVVKDVASVEVVLGIDVMVLEKVVLSVVGLVMVARIDLGEEG